MDRRWLQEKVLPTAFVGAVRKLSKEQFLLTWGDTQFLLVKLEDAVSEVAQGLAGASTLGGDRLRPTYDSLAYATVMDDSVALFANARARRSEPALKRPYDATTLETQLLRTPHFVAPLRKRPIAGKPFVERISVGRAHNNDIVLRHGGVSKFHAWLECDEARQFYICDARSRNGTTVNGKPVTSELVLLKPGDELRFGQVQATLCPPELFWEVLNKK